MLSPIEFKFKYQQKKTAKEEKLYLCTDRFFIVIHWLTVLLITSASFFTGVSQTDVDAWNMTQYCEEERFNQIVSPISRKWAVVTIVIVTLTIVCLMSIKMVIFGAMSKDLLEIMNFFLGLLLSWDVTYVLQSVISYPVPSFYKNDELKWLYCCGGCPKQKLTKQLVQLDMESRGSFPSFLICASSYTTVFLFLLSSYLDEGRRFAAKLLALLVPGLVCVVYGWLLWQNNENHLQDVIGGGIIGALLAAYIVQDVFRKDNKLNKFTDDFISVLMAREMELAHLNSTNNSNREARHGTNEYTINLYSRDDTSIQAMTILEDRPPPYSSI